MVGGSYPKNTLPGPSASCSVFFPLLSQPCIVRSVCAQARLAGNGDERQGRVCSARAGVDSGEMNKQQWERWVVSAKISSAAGSENRTQGCHIRGLSREAMNPDFLEHWFLNVIYDPKLLPTSCRSSLSCVASVAWSIKAGRKAH